MPQISLGETVPRVAIVTDSMACLTQGQTSEYDIRVVPIAIHFDGRVYHDGVDLSASEAYHLLERAPDRFTTSPPTPEEWASTFRELATKTGDILCITLSAKLSTEINLVNLAREQLKKDFPNVNIETIDSQNVAAGQALIVLYAARLAKQGKLLAEIAQAVHDLRNHVHLLLVFETMRYIYRTGRIPKTAARIAAATGVKPVVTVAEGSLHFRWVTRNKRHGINRLIEMMHHLVGSKLVHVAVMHADSPKEAEELEKRVGAQFNCVELFVAEFSPAIGYGTGPGVVGLAFHSSPEETSQ